MWIAHRTRKYPLTLCRPLSPPPLPHSFLEFSHETSCSTRQRLSSNFDTLANQILFLSSFRVYRLLSTRSSIGSLPVLKVTSNRQLDLRVWTANQERFSSAGTTVIQDALFLVRYVENSCNGAASNALLRYPRRPIPANGSIRRIQFAGNGVPSQV